MKIDWVETKCGVRQIITIICVTYVQKDYQIRALIKQLLTKYQICTKLPQISHFHKNSDFYSLIELLEKVYLRSQILECLSIGEYWNISGVPVLPENVIFMFFIMC